MKIIIRSSRSFEVGPNYHNNGNDHGLIAKPFDNKPSHSMCCHLAIGAGTKIIPIVLLKCVLHDHNSNNCTQSSNVCCCTYMVNYYDKFRSFSRLYDFISASNLHIICEIF